MHYLACDLGAESGRLMLGTLNDSRLQLEELHRFPNKVLTVKGSLHWDMLNLVNELKAGLKVAADRGLQYAGISTDSWGVDYVLLTAEGTIIPPTYHYRDPRTARGVNTVYSKLAWPDLFAETGLQFMALNTIFQLAAEDPARLRAARQLLLVADAFNYFLSGKAAAEVSLASTSQLYNPQTRAWSDKLLGLLGVPPSLFPEIIPSGTRLGPLKPELCAETGLGSVEVIASCSHDTGAAVAAVPAQGEDWAYLSSGTWSLIGVELPQPLINDACRELNFTNEIGYGNSVRLLKNIVGLWIVQECRRFWADQGQEYDYAALAELAAAAPPFVSLINPNDQRFVAPGDMPSRIEAFCGENDEPIPSSPGAMIRCVLESLALLYRRTLGQIEDLTGRKIARLHVVGGGSKNALLNQFTANALQIPVLAGPVEATAIGNILVQAIAMGELPSLAAARELVRSSTELVNFTPADAAAWESAYTRFSRLLK